MYYSLKYLLVSFLILTSCTLTAQTINDNDQSLLWRITGNGLTKPSYLFGTIHLTDRRLFRHDDSVFAAIDNSEGLAIELNPNEMAAYYLNKMLDDAEDDRKVSDIIDQEDLDKYDKYFKKKFGKSAKEVTTKDLIKEKNKWVSQYLKKGGMPTFLDAYLYTIANRQGKWTGGIEDIQDQMNIADRADINLLAASEEPTDLETLINMYINSDLNGINTVINKYSPQYKDALLTRRNIKMARRMDSLAQFRSMFFAVGAAHLPGDSGVINMLRARGFTMEPVHSLQKTDADKYDFKTKGIDRWTDVVGEKNLYTVQMPGEPSTIKMYGLIEMKYVADFSDMTAYMTMAIIGTTKNENQGEIAENYARRVFNKDKIKKSKVRNGEIDGYEIIDESGSTWIRIQIFSVGKVTYVATTSANAIAKLKSDRMDRFFSSFKMTTSENSSESSYAITDSVLAYRATSPVELTLNERLTKQTANKDWRVKIYTGQDLATGAYVMLTTKDVPSGYYIPNDSAFLADIYSGMSSQCTGNKKDTVIHGYNAMLFSCKQDPNISLKMLSVVRGNKSLNFALVSSEELRNDERLNSIFNSLELLPYKISKWETRTTGDNTFSAYTPAPITSDQDSSAETSQTEARFYSYDSLTATTYYIITEALHKYTWTDNDTTLLKEKQSEYFDKKQTLLSERMEINDKTKSIEITYKDSGAILHHRLKTIYHNNIIYHLYSVAEKSVLESTNVDQFFSGFKINTANSFDLNKNKAPMLLHDLKSSDSATFTTAVFALDETQFLPKDWPELYATILDTFPNIKNESQRSTALFFVKRKIGAIGDTAIISFVKKNYVKQNGNNDIGLNLLSLLAQLQTPESYKTLFGLLEEDPLKGDRISSLIFSVNDSLLLLKSVYPEVMKLIGDTNNISLAASITNQLLDTGMISLQMVKDSAEVYASTAALVVKSNLREDDWSWSVYNLLNLLDTINTPEAINVITSALEAKNSYIRYRAAMILTKKNINVPAETWENFAKDIDTRSMLYTGLKDINKEHLFPKQYANQKSIAESEMYDMATEEYEEATVEFLNEKTESINGKKHRFYLYKVSYKIDDELSEYLGVIGGYDLRGKLLIPEENYSNIYWEEQYTDGNMDMLFDKYKHETENQD